MKKEKHIETCEGDETDLMRAEEERYSRALKEAKKQARVKLKDKLKELE
jgi:hypothetical protein